MNTHSPLSFLLVASVAACSSSSPAPTPTAPGPPVELSGTLIDKDTNQPVAGSIVIVEVGGLYQPNADTSKGNPFYKISALSGADGSFKVTVPGGMVGLHTFQNGYFYGVLGPIDATAAPGGHVVNPKSLLPKNLKPTATGFAFSPATVAAGAMVTLGVDVAKGDAADVLSEEIIAAETTSHWAAVLDPPSPGKQGTGFPDGHYAKTFAAPTAPGVYTYALVVSSEGCVTSDRTSTTLTVQ